VFDRETDGADPCRVEQHGNRCKRRATNMNAAYALDTRMNAEAVTLVLSPSVVRNHLLNDLIDSGVILAEDWRNSNDHVKRPILEAQNEEDLLARLIDAQWLTPFQASQVRSAGAANLMLGNYRLLEEIGAGGMGIVYRG